MPKHRVVSALLMLALLGACAEGNEVSPSPSPVTSDPLTNCDAASATDESAQAVATVVTVDLAYLPGCFIARSEGQVLRLKNADHVTHTFTVDGTDLDLEIPAGSSVKTEGDAADAGLVPGTYPFHCRIHASMRGVVIVR